MDLSVVVPTLNGRAQLTRCLDALSEHAPDAEIIVVNGPSTDGTTGMVRERAEVDVLVEIADRNLNVARNAGLDHARGEWVAFVSDEYSIEPSWRSAVDEAIGTDEADDGRASRLADALVDPLAGAGATVTDATRTVLTYSKRLAVRVRADDVAEDAIAGDTSTDDDTLVNGASVNEGTSPDGDANDAGDGESTAQGQKGESEQDGDEASEERDGTGSGEESERSTDELARSDPDERADGLPAVVTGPVHRELIGGTTTQSPESRIVAGRSVEYFNPDNVAVRRDALDATDGFDEYLRVGGARDLAHRLAAREYAVTWNGGLCVRGEYGADGTGRDLRWDARSLSYRLVKNYGVRPTVLGRLAERAAGDGFLGTRGAVRGELSISQWLAAARDVTAGLVLGTVDGFRARWRDRERRNPNGRSSRADRAVEVYDRR